MCMHTHTHNMDSAFNFHFLCLFSSEKHNSILDNQLMCVCALHLHLQVLQNEQTRLLSREQQPLWSQI